MHPPEAGLLSALHQSRPRSGGFRASRRRHRRVARAGQQARDRQRRDREAQADGAAADRPRARGHLQRRARGRCAAPVAGDQLGAGRGGAALRLAAAAAVQVAGRGGDRANRGARPDAAYLAAVACQPCRRSDLSARAGLPVRARFDRHSGSPAVS